MTYSYPTADQYGTFRYPDGEIWDAYVWKKGELRTLEGGVHDSDAPDNTRMVAELLLNEVMFCNSRHYITDSYSPPRTSNISTQATIVCFVICNDIFAWACADTERVSLDELPRLYDMWKADPVWGAVRWCILKRKQRPQAPVLKAMKEAGAWDEELDKL